MRVNLLEVLQKTLGTNGLTAIAGFLDEPPAKTEESFFISSAVVIRELANRAKPGEIWNTLAGNEKVSPDSVLDLPPQVIRSKMANLCEQGTGLFAQVFGKSCEAMVKSVSTKLNCPAEKATSNLGLATIYTLSALRKWGDASQQPKQAVRNLLEQQKSHLGAPEKPKTKKSFGFLLAPIVLLAAGYFAWPYISSFIPGMTTPEIKVPVIAKPKPVENPVERLAVKPDVKQAVQVAKETPPVLPKAASTSVANSSATDIMNQMISSPDKAITVTSLSVLPEIAMQFDKSLPFIVQLAAQMKQKKEGKFQVRSHVYSEVDLASNKSKSAEISRHLRSLFVENGVPNDRIAAVSFGSAIPVQDKSMQTKLEFRYLLPTEP